MHTPRLCIDGRAAAEFDAQGLMAQELIDQLVSAQGEPGCENEWIERRRTVLLTHPGQVFAGQLRRFDTKRKIGSTFFYSAWEKHFVESANISAFHRFRPVDRLEPLLDCPTITTVLPARRSLPSDKLPIKPEHAFVVPSRPDAVRLTTQLGVPEDAIRVATCSARRFVHHAEILPQQDGQILFLVDEREDLDLKKLHNILGNQYPHLPLRTLSLADVREFSPRQWTKSLQFSSLCFYLTERPFDWPFLALESLYFRVPMIFMDNHAALAEMFPLSPMRLSMFLTDFTTSSQLRETVEEMRARADHAGAFDGFKQAQQYGDIYAGIPSA